MISQQWPQVQWPYSATEQKQQQVGAPSNETNKILATTVQGQFPELNAQQANAVLQHLLG
jgi:hypothetical protein